MDRLTEKRDGQNVISLRQDGKTKWSLCSAGMGDAPTKFLYGDHADRLAEYEDLEEQGKLLKLPVAVGDTVFIIVDKAEILDYIITSISVEKYSIFFFTKTHIFLLPDFEKNVFLTREEAEAALQKIKEPEAE